MARYGLAASICGNGVRSARIPPWTRLSSHHRRTRQRKSNFRFRIPEDLLVLNAIWRWRRQMRKAYDDHLAEYEARLIAAVAADQGHAP